MPLSTDGRMRDQCVHAAQKHASIESSGGGASCAIGYRDNRFFPCTWIPAQCASCAGRPTKSTQRRLGYRDSGYQTSA
eukprot:2215295-Amphidinium_carterae.1